MVAVLPIGMAQVSSVKLVENLEGRIVQKGEEISHFGLVARTASCSSSAMYEFLDTRVPRPKLISSTVRSWPLLIQLSLFSRCGENVRCNSKGIVVFLAYICSAMFQFNTSIDHHSFLLLIYRFT